MTLAPDISEMNFDGADMVVVVTSDIIWWVFYVLNDQCSDDILVYEDKN